MILPLVFEFEIIYSWANCKYKISLNEVSECGKVLKILVLFYGILWDSRYEVGYI
jgi:hypothetical protein